jgi:hypothetical protein
MKQVQREEAVRDICEHIVKQSGKWGDVLRGFEG